jgi:hypothetical protein
MFRWEKRAGESAAKELTEPVNDRDEDRVDGKVMVKNA